MCTYLAHPKITVGNKAAELAENVFKTGFLENHLKIVIRSYVTLSKSCNKLFLHYIIRNKSKEAATK